MCVYIYIYICMYVYIYIYIYIYIYVSTNGVAVNFARLFFPQSAKVRYFCSPRPTLLPPGRRVNL